jgi:hypothetical protein
LGDWADELSKDIWTADWVSTGPKSYCYKTDTGKVVCKIIVYYITRHESDTLQTRRRVEEYEAAKRPSTSSSLRVTHRHFHVA